LKLSQCGERPVVAAMPEVIKFGSLVLDLRFRREDLW